MAKQQTKKTKVKSKPKAVKKKVVKKKVVKKTVVKESPANDKVIVKETKVKTKEKKPTQKKKEKQNVEKPEIKKSSVPQAFGGYTEEQYKVYCNTLKEWENKTNDEIKKELQKNNQSRTGNKAKILIIYYKSDGMALGQIPRCPECFGGRPKFNQKNGTYHCSGYMDDDVFKNCHKNFTLETLQRLPWVTD